MLEAKVKDLTYLKAFWTNTQDQTLMDRSYVSAILSHQLWKF
jgi:hypothetical protein